MKFTAALVLGVAGVAFAQPWTGKGIVAHEGKPVGKEVDYDGCELILGTKSILLLPCLHLCSDALCQRAQAQHR